MSRPPVLYTQETADSIMGHDDPMEHVEVWQDTSAERGYNTYLVGQNSNVLDSSDGQANVRPTFAERPTFAMADRATMAARPDIRIGKVEDGEKVKKYSGRKTVWPGWLLLFLIFAGSIFGIVWFSIKLYNSAQKQQQKSELILNRTPRPITPAKICEQPNFVNVNGTIYAKYASGAPSQKIVITGINWSGMENPEGVPHGLAFGQAALDDIVERMAKQGMTAVRLPLNVKMLNANSAPDVKDFVDPVVNPQLVVTDYMSMIKVVVQGLAKQGVSVLLDMHKLDPVIEGKTEGLWYNVSSGFPTTALETAIATLGKELCNSNYYNVLGVDLKNEPFSGCWPGSDKDASCPDAMNWPKAAGRLADIMLAACPNWMAFVEGVASGTLTRTGYKSTGPDAPSDNTTFYYQEWWGAALSNLTKYPVQVSPANKNKLVYVPHFYSPSVYPAPYYFASFKSIDGGATTTEWPNTPEGNAALKLNVYRALDLAFGNAVNGIQSPVMYGEFGGIYGDKDKFPLKTSSRVIDLFIQYAQDKGMSGGFMWSLNPDSEYQYNGDTTKAGKFNYGLYAINDIKPWSGYNQDYSEALLKFKGTGTIACVKIDAPGSANATVDDTNATTKAPATTKKAL
ncbi:Aste57867_1443 [Aphanomyces stellatus]|uniref:Aste57867_1443 protein n=1 Tax=Aphanomyces stellatus TaxID=120398 RepID=A0A485K5N2_9STRA|nr:hypothetical protein As57867_001442 [Aphanomyces stellatus]VFT78660.1 Aste57867_1443 [Aphanomyces stellatus]